MLMQLAQLSPASAVDPNASYDDELEDVDAIITDICVALGETGAFRFRVGGFGDEAWPVDVSTDLATVVEQLPAALSALRQARRFEVNFFEQGIERYLDFEPVPNGYRIACRSLADWSPDPVTEVLTVEELRQMLHGLGTAFTDIVRAQFPKTSQHPWLQEYFQTIR